MKAKTTKTLIAKTVKKPSPVKAAPGIETPATPSVRIGDEVPGITLPDQDGNTISLASEAAQNPYVVIYFYPKDDTPGCTKEACDFRDNINRLTENGVRVLGVSPDSPESHKKFIEKYGLNFPLLSDTEKDLSQKVGVWKLKKFMGREYMGVERSTLLVKDGRIAKVWQPVSVEGHVDDVLNTVSQLKT